MRRLLYSDYETIAKKYRDNIFKNLTKTHPLKNLDDLNAEKGRIANVMLKEIGGLNKETRTMLGKTIATLFREGNQVIKSNLNNNKNKKNS